ncbi:MAG: hypothetical protein QOF33_1304 [Thermomicrobiales bacterium]|nr:hypothetical protein [Thermomicrobiales bacterium]
MAERSSLDMDNAARSIGSSGSEMTDNFPGGPIDAEGGASGTTDAADIIAGIGNRPGNGDTQSPEQPMGSGPGFGTAASGADASGGETAASEVDLGRGSGDPNRPIKDEQGAVGMSRGSGEGSIGEATQ